MSKLRLPGSSLLDRCIGRSTFQYNQGIKLNPFASNLTYDSFIKTLSKYEPTMHRLSWTYTTPFGSYCVLSLKFLSFSLFYTQADRAVVVSIWDHPNGLHVYIPMTQHNRKRILKFMNFVWAQFGIQYFTFYPLR